MKATLPRKDTPLPRGQALPEEPGFPSRIVLGIALGIALLVVVCHLRVLCHAGALWRDEVGIVNSAIQPTLADVWSSLSLESFPVFSFLVFRGWLAFFSPQNDLALRVLGLCLGLGICAGLFWNARLARSSACAAGNGGPSLAWRLSAASQRFSLTLTISLLCKFASRITVCVQSELHTWFSPQPSALPVCPRPTTSASVAVSTTLFAGKLRW